VIGCGLIVFFYGYRYYSEAKQSRSLEETVALVRNREDYVEIDEISPYFLNAIMAIEDRRFMLHSGIDIIGIARALVSNLVAGEIVQGGSTISQQLAKNLFFSNQQTLIRKVAELLMTMDIERSFSKKEILELYSNIIYLGQGNYGVEAASREYFNKDAIDLNLEEAAFIAGVTQSPTAYTTNIELGKERQREVLDALSDFEVINFDTED